MEECNKRKRVPDDSFDSPESKIHRVDSAGSDVNSFGSLLTRAYSGVNSSESQLTRVDSDESCLNSEIQDDFFNILDDTDNVPERDSAIQGLDSVMKSFEEEILAPGSDSNPEPGSGELQPNLGYLLEASDDELGLPPTAKATETEKPDRVGPEGVDLSGFLGFEDDMQNYNSFGFGNGLVAECDGDNGVAGDFVAVDGLFDYAETADNLWRFESLQAM